MTSGREASIARIETADGVLWAYRFSPDGKAERIEGAVSLDRLLAAEGWVWLHMTRADERACKFIEHCGFVPAEARRSLLAADEHPCIEAGQGFVHGVFDDLRRELSGLTEDVSRLHFFLDERLVVTLRRRPLNAVAETQKKIEAGQTPYRPLGLIEMIVQEFSRVIETMLAEQAGRLDAIEDAVLAHGSTADRAKLIPLRHSTVKAHRQLLILRAMFHRADAPGAADGFAGLREMAARLARRFDTLDQDAGALQERSRLLHQEMNSIVTAQVNAKLQFLSIFTAIFLPPTLVTGFFGMNTKDLLWNQTENGSFYAAAVVAASVACAVFVLRRLRVI